MQTEIILLAGLFVNFIGVLLAVFLSRIKIERRLVALETYMKVMINTRLPDDPNSSFGS